MTETTRERVRQLVQAALDERHMAEQLGDALEELIERIDAEPELRKAVIRNNLRGTLMSSFWLQ